MAKRAWILHYKDIGQEDFFATYLTEAAALKRMSDAVAGYAREQRDAIEWDADPLAQLAEVIKADQEGRHNDAVEAWREFDFDYGPSDRNVLLIDSEVMD